MSMRIGSDARVLYAGDPHGGFSEVREAVAREAPDAVVMLGDYDLEQPLEEELSEILATCEVYWIAGNHDGDREHWHDNLFGSALSEFNLHGRVKEICGLRIAGLGGVFRGALWFPGQDMKFRSRQEWLNGNARSARWRGGIPRRHRCSIWKEDYEALRNQEADVLVCHEAPSSHRCGFAVIDELADAMGAELIVHGHHHVDYVDSVKDGIQVLGVGLGSVATADGKVVARRVRHADAV